MATESRPPGGAPILATIALGVAIVALGLGALARFGGPRGGVPLDKLSGYEQCVTFCNGQGLTSDAIIHCIDGCAKVFGGTVSSSPRPTAPASQGGTNR